MPGVRQRATHVIRRTLVLSGLGALLGIWTPSPLPAQDSTCAYDQCALALHRGFWSTYLVRGDSAARVARIGFRAPRLADLAARQDSTGFYIRQFRAQHTSGNWLLLLGGLTAAAGQLVAFESRQEAVGAGIMLVGLGVMFTGGERTRRGANSLQRAIWFYNRSLAR
jgi:hypothetical protein